MKKNVKIIFHIDLNAFFASCAAIKEPYLKDKAFVVGGSSTFRRGVVSTASYQARKMGIHSAMNINDAMRIHPKLIIVPLQFSLYQKYSKLFFNYLKQYSSIILEGSIDEAYVDMTKQAETKKASALKAAHAKKQADKAAETTKNPFDMGVGATKQTGTLNTVKKDTDNLKQTIINAPDTSVQDISAPSATTVQDHPTASTSTDQAAPTAVTTEQNAATALGSDNVGGASSDVKQLGVRTVDPSKSSYDSSSI